MPLLLPPPALSVPAPPVPGRNVDIVMFQAGKVVCDGQAIAGTAPVRPFSTAVIWYGSTRERAVPATYRLGFAIDENGRPATIHREGPQTYPGYYINTSDLAPSLAVSRFPGGAARRHCSVAYTATSTPVATAPLPALYELASMPEPAAGLEELLDRVRPSGSDCPRGPGPYRRLNQPAFETIAQPPGTWSWTFLAYDVDTRGKPTNVRVLASAGNPALDRASVKALAANRFAPGPGYRGCIYHFYRNGPSLDAAPELPSGTAADNGDLPACRIDPKTIQSLLQGSAYPQAFSRRRVEGVAAISYDTAPWGAIGNVKVVASEPDEAFGEAVRNAVSGARVVESDAGHRGCFRRIRFKLPPEPSPG